jgi:serine/threonine protein kinase
LWLREDIFKEIDILCGLNHENVVYLKEYFEEGNKVHASAYGSVPSPLIARTAHTIK